MKEVRKVKSVQMFKRPVQRASQGDRVGMCVTQFDAKLLERGIACAPGYVTTIHGGVIDMVGRVHNTDGATWKIHIPSYLPTYLASGIALNPWQLNGNQVL